MWPLEDVYRVGDIASTTEYALYRPPTGWAIALHQAGGTESCMIDVANSIDVYDRGRHPIPRTLLLPVRDFFVNEHGRSRWGPRSIYRPWSRFCFARPLVGNARYDVRPWLQPAASSPSAYKSPTMAKWRLIAQGGYLVLRATRPAIRRRISGRPWNRVAASRGQYRPLGAQCPMCHRPCASAEYRPLHLTARARCHHAAPGAVKKRCLHLAGRILRISP